jgi:hypothetical protein
MTANGTRMFHDRSNFNVHRGRYVAPVNRRDLEGEMSNIWREK